MELGVHLWIHHRLCLRFFTSIWLLILLTEYIIITSSNVPGEGIVSTCKKIISIIGVIIKLLNMLKIKIVTLIFSY